MKAFPIPEGWRQVLKGKVHVGDKTWWKVRKNSCGTLSGFKVVIKNDICVGDNVDEFWCVIRKKEIKK